MLSKRTKKLQEGRMTPKRQRFAIKKLTVGVASVLIGTFFSLFMSIGTAIISADETSTQPVEEVNDSSIETPSSDEEPNLEKMIVTAEEVSKSNETPKTTVQSEAVSRTNDTTIQNNEPIIKEQPKLFATVPIDLKGSKIEFNKPTLHVNQDIDAINDLLTREYVENTIIKKLTLSDGTVYEGQALKDVLNENVASYDWSDTPEVDVASDDVYARLRASLNNRRTVTWLMEVNVVGAKAKENLHTPWGTEINAIDAIANTAELKEFDTAIAPVSYDWKEKPNFSPEAGSDHKVTGVVSVNYPDGTTQDVEVTISVDESDAEKYEPKGQNVNTGLNETPKAEDGISNKSDLPESTTYEWKVPVDTSTSGEKDGVVVVKYPDGSSEEVSVKIVVTDKTTDAVELVPTGQDKGSSPESMKPDVKASANRKVTSDSSGYALPATGDNDSAGLVGLGALLLGSLGLVATRRKKEEV
ncbi:Rib/alpha-like domain-containing protein [Lactococcus muris]|uniref:Rib/alpha-like domain-containing protein n=1 Tax=Lactococcus muris TaxID=2941330 RepID=UPI0022FFDBB7